MRTVIQVEGSELARPILRAHLYQALDRPSRLEVEVLTGRSGGLPGSLPAPVGSRVTLASGGETCFCGVVERCGRRVDADEGPVSWLVAYSDYHRHRLELRRRGSALGPWYQATDSETAERIASALQLVASVDPTTRVHPVVEPRGDPLRFLRERARECGYELAVWDGRLHFVRSLSSPEAACVPSSEDVLGFEVEERRSGSSTIRGGRLEHAGDWRLRPLLSLDLERLDGGSGGRYRSVRTLHALDRSRFRTVVELVAEGFDYSLWQEQDVESEIVDLKE